MSSSRFDGLTKSLATTTERRTVAKLMVGSALGALGLARLGGEPALAARKRNGEPCNQNGTNPNCRSGCCVRHTCRPKGRCN